MATNYNITMKRYNGTDYDVLYPRTLPSQIDGGVYTKDEATGLFLSKTGGQMSGLLDMNGNKISNLAAPTAANDAATKDYVDNNSYIQTKTLVKSLSQSEIASLKTDGEINLFSADSYVYQDYQYVMTVIKDFSMSVNASSVDTRINIGAFQVIAPKGMLITGTRIYTVHPTVCRVGDSFKLLVFGYSGGYDANIAKTYEAENYINSVQADSIEIYLCK